MWKLPFQAAADVGPLVVDHGKIDAVPVAAIGVKHVLAEVSLFFRSEAEDGGAGLGVLRVSLPLDTAASKHLEGVPICRSLASVLT